MPITPTVEIHNRQETFCLVICCCSEYSWWFGIISQNVGFAEGSEQVLKEVGINCWEVPGDRLPLYSGIRLVYISAGIVAATLGHQRYRV
jgi:hypothetical protein